MAKRARVEDVLAKEFGQLEDTVRKRFDMISTYVRELEIGISNTDAQYCDVPHCRRYVVEGTKCAYCDRTPNACILCGFDEFARCTAKGGCGKFFCRSDGDTADQQCHGCARKDTE